MNPLSSKYPGWRLCMTAGWLYILTGCNGGISKTAETPSTELTSFCKTQRQHFHQKAWGPLLVKTCQGCHNTSGLASLDAHSRFVLLPEAYPNAAQANLSLISSLAKEQVSGSSYLLSKVSGKIPHGGGNIYPEGSEGYVQLQNFIAQLDAPLLPSSGGPPPSCENVSPTMDERLNAARTLDAQATFRKAAINISGRLPTPEENMRLAQFPERLGESMDALLEEKAFYVRLKEVFNDAFILSREGQEWFDIRHFQYRDIYERNEDGENVYRETVAVDYPNFDTLNQNKQTRETHISLWEEPLALIAYIAQNNRPFTEILTANYTVINPYTAFLYGLQASPPPLQAPIDEWTPATELRQRRGTSTEALVPRAGVLTSAAFLTRWTSTYSNRSRGRAEFVSKNFLANSILSFALRPVDSTQLDSTQRPTVNNPACSVCHYYMDPLAAAFSGFTLGWQHASYKPHEGPWNEVGALAGFQGEAFEFPVKDTTKAMPWIAQRIAADPRFPYAMVLRVFEGITGRKPLEYPRDTLNPNYALLLSAWESQNAFLHNVASRMAQQGMNIKVAFKEILLSPYFRAAQDSNLPAELAIGLGEGRLLTPEMLARKIRATLGAHWGGFRNEIPRDYELLASNSYNILYGGLHPSQNPQRLTQINTVMLAIARTMAQEMGCRIPAWEFSKPPHERTVLTKVQQDTVPLRQNSPAGPFEVDTEGERAIRENLAYLHERLLGETVPPNSPEVNLSYGLFVDTWKERQEASPPHTNIDNWSCSGRWDLSKPNENNTGFATLPTEQQIVRDASFTLYAWETVLTYMLMDFRFIHE
ncbi:MAG: DUF1588 domain-containing protein [Proteobacteria bacterium]|nr:DUF1588 domain-containing protein [Cystobacterineae bacterium]MCL2259575.1 DUF1588 domain-containing protein [Cystobacterineae bacterium]MCL2313948.1 DUF1588 domain-containing protein [Pseudomonadota bacterium]